MGSHRSQPLQCHHSMMTSSPNHLPLQIGQYGLCYSPVTHNIKWVRHVYRWSTSKTFPHLTQDISHLEIVKCSLNTISHANTLNSLNNMYTVWQAISTYSHCQSERTYDHRCCWSSLFRPHIHYVVCGTFLKRNDTTLETRLFIEEPAKEKEIYTIKSFVIIVTIWEKNRKSGKELGGFRHLSSVKVQSADMLPG